MQNTLQCNAGKYFKSACITFTITKCLYSLENCSFLTKICSTIPSLALEKENWSIDVNLVSVMCCQQVSLTKYHLHLVFWQIRYLGAGWVDHGETARTIMQTGEKSSYEHELGRQGRKVCIWEDDPVYCGLRWVSPIRSAEHCERPFLYYIDREFRYCRISWSAVCFVWCLMKVFHSPVAEDMNTIASSAGMAT